MELSNEAKAARAKYAREWRRKNPDKVKAYDAKKWENRANNKGGKDGGKKDVR